MTITAFHSLIGQLGFEPSANARSFVVEIEDSHNDATISLTNDSHHVRIDLSACDLANLSGSARDSFIRLLLAINETALRRSCYSVGIDKDMVVVSGRIAIQSATALTIKKCLHRCLNVSSSLRVQLSRMPK